jgi:hypothetical protein
MLILMPECGSTTDAPKPDVFPEKPPPPSSPTKVPRRLDLRIDIASDVAEKLLPFASTINRPMNTGCRDACGPTP